MTDVVSAQIEFTSWLFEYRTKKLLQNPQTAIDASDLRYACAFDVHNAKTPMQLLRIFSLYADKAGVMLNA